MSAYPSFFAECILSNEEALKRAVRPGTTLASGFATSEPHTFYSALWDHIVREDLCDINIRQALFMAPHRLCVGDALQSQGMFKGLAERLSDRPALSNFARKVNMTTRKLEGLGKLIGHYEELLRRRITFTSPFIGAATNAVIPDNPITRALYPDYVGRNTTRMGITHMQSIHFPDAVDSMGYDPDGNPLVDTFVAVMTPPDDAGFMSHGVANGANGEIIQKALERKTVNVLLYVNPKYPFTRGYRDDDSSRNTIHVSEFEGLAKAGKLFVVEDDGPIPALPPGSLAEPSPSEQAIAQQVVNHIEMNLALTRGRALQVGFGSTGVQAIKGLLGSSWEGRAYTEMLEPFTMQLFESGKIHGTHFIEPDGRRTQLDGKIAATFSLCEQGSTFYDRLNNPNVIVAPASRIVIPEGFYGGMGINNCLAIDFHGHVNAGGRDKNHHSGVGGGAQILRGLAKGGIAYLCMKSTHTTPEGRLRSSIFPFMPQGTPIAYVGPDVMGGRDGARFFLVTEHGVARLNGRSQAEFIKSLISVAHPHFKDMLKHQAWREFRVRV